MDPVVSNSVSNTCGQTISSNCVIVNDGSVCGPQTLTSVLNGVTTAVAKNSSCCGGTFPPGSVSAYTGLWVDFSAGIPTSGSFVGGTWVLSSIGGTGLYTPQYRWTPDGDLLVRGTASITLSPTVTQSGFLIPLVALSALNFPTNWTASQSILTTVFSNAAGSQSIEQNGSCLLQLDYPTGILSLSVQFIDLKLATLGIGPINFSARFNNA